MMQPKKTKRAPKTNKHEPTKGKQTRTWQRPRSKQTSMENSKHSTNMQKGTNPNPLLKLGCMNVGLDH